MACTAILQELQSTYSSFQFKGAVLWISRGFMGLVYNMIYMYSLKFIAVSKTTLVYSVNPLWWAIVAGIFLQERLNIILVLSTISAWGGIYLLTINKPQENESSEHQILGYLFSFMSAWIIAGVFAQLRALKPYNIDPKCISFYIGIFFALQVTYIYLFYPNLINIWNYDFIDITLLLWIGFSGLAAQAFMVLANKYAMASRMAPFSNLENVLTIIADILIFNYSFIITDLFGIAIIVIAIFAPVIYISLQSKK